MANEEQVNGEEASAPAKKKLPVATLLLLLQSLVTLGAAGFVIWALTHPPKPPVSQSQLKERVISSIKDRDEDLKTIELEEFQVNVKSGGTMRAKLVLEVSNSQVEESIKNRLPRIKDLVSSSLSEVEKKDIRDIQGKLAVKNNLRNSLNNLVIPMLAESNPGLIREVYIVELLVN